VGLFVAAAVENSEQRTSKRLKLPRPEPKSAPDMSSTAGGRMRSPDRLDRISTAICARAVQLQIGELRQLVRLSLARELRPQLADLKEQIKADILSLSEL
jgi:hypothetical protein